MNKLNEIENIIFDLGGVVLNLNYQLTVDAFVKNLPELNSEYFFGKEDQLPFFSKYEVGLISTKDFKAQFEEHYKVQFSEEDFKKHWNAMILNFPLERITLLRNLKKLGKKIFLLSNINEMHEEEVEKKFLELNLEFSFKDLFDVVYYSHHIHMRKPEKEIFEYVISTNELIPNKTLFIDDSLHHIRTAEKCGLRTIHLESPQKLENLELFKTMGK